MADPNLRIGDEERDRAAALLQEHLAAGRLQADEFDERVSRALMARTGRDLADLFDDLPGPRPHMLAPAGDAKPTAAEPTFAEPATPWYAHWVMIVVAAALTAVTRGRAGALIPLACVWVFWLYPQVVRGRRPPRPATRSVYELPEGQQQEVTRLLEARQKIAAIKRYREFTGAGLAEATDAVEAWQRQLPH